MAMDASPLSQGQNPMKLNLQIHPEEVFRLIVKSIGLMGCLLP